MGELCAICISIFSFVYIYISSAIYPRIVTIKLNNGEVTLLWETLNIASCLIGRGTRLHMAAGCVKVYSLLLGTLGGEHGMVILGVGGVIGGWVEMAR